MTEEREAELEIPTFQRLGISITPAERVKKISEEKRDQIKRAIAQAINNSIRQEKIVDAMCDKKEDIADLI